MLNIGMMRSQRKLNQSDDHGIPWPSVATPTGLCMKLLAPHLSKQCIRQYFDNGAETLGAKAAEKSQCPTPANAYLQHGDTQFNAYEKEPP